MERGAQREKQGGGKKNRSHVIEILVKYKQIFFEKTMIKLSVESQSPTNLWLIWDGRRKIQLSCSSPWRCTIILDESQSWKSPATLIVQFCLSDLLLWSIMDDCWKDGDNDNDKTLTLKLLICMKSINGAPERLEQVHVFGSLLGAGLQANAWSNG